MNYKPLKVLFIRGAVTVSKQDAATGAALAGAVFTLTPVTGKSMGTETITATTGVDGKATFNDVLYGTYTLTETTAPTHYTAWNGSKEVTVAKNGDTVDAGTVEDVIFTGTVTVLKTDARGCQVWPVCQWGCGWREARRYGYEW